MRLLNAVLSLGIITVATAQAGFPLSDLLPHKELHRAALHNFVDVIAENKDEIKHGINHHLDNGDDDDDYLDIGSHFPNPKPHLDLMDIISHANNNNGNENTRSIFSSLFKLFGKKVASSAGKGISNNVFGREQSRLSFGKLFGKKGIGRFFGKHLVEGIKKQTKKHLQPEYGYNGYYPEQQRGLLDWLFG
uniref:Secreted protein n=1 Tax=Panagrellus redivivus TaxID=6233 RepID=A0A7E4WD37_PANRE